MAVIFQNSFGIAKSHQIGAPTTNVQLFAKTKGAEKEIRERLFGNANPKIEETRKSGSLSDALGFTPGDWGFATSMTGVFREAITENGKDLNTSADALRPEFALQGLVFAQICGENGESSQRHGLEGLLHFWQQNRVSKAKASDDAVFVQVCIGKTILEGALGEFSFRPMDTDFRSIAWTMGLSIDPDYTSYTIGGGS